MDKNSEQDILSCPLLLMNRHVRLRKTQETIPFAWLLRHRARQECMNERMQVDSHGQGQYHEAFGHPGISTVTNRSPSDESENTDLTDTEVQLLDLYESMSADAQAALTRLAQFFEAHPQDEPTTKEKMAELFLAAKSMQ